MSVTTRFVAAAVSAALVGMIGILLLVAYPGLTQALVAVGTLALATATAALVAHDIAQEDRSWRPHLEMVVLDEVRYDANRMEEGTVLAVKNFGPGVATDLRATFWMAPTEGRAPGFEERMIPARIGPVGARCEYLHAGERDAWFVHSETPSVDPKSGRVVGSMPRIPYDVDVEIRFRDVLGREQPPRRYSFRRGLAKTPDVWAWRKIEEPWS